MNRTDDALSAELAALPQPATPPDLAAIVMARIAQSAPPVAATARTPARATRDWPTWVSLGGLAAGLAIVLVASFSNAAPLDLAWLEVRGFTNGVGAMPATAAGALILTVGLVIYVAGLFAPLRRVREGS